MWIENLFLAVLLVVQAKSQLDKNELTAEGYPVWNNDPVGKIQVHYLPNDAKTEQDRGNETKVQSNPEMTNSKQLDTPGPGNGFPNERINMNSGLVLQPPLHQKFLGTYSTDVHVSEDYQKDIKKEKPTETSIQASVNPGKILVHSKEFAHEETRNPGVEKRIDLNNSLRYFGFLFQHNTGDLKVDPEFEHLPNAEPESEHLPKIDPEFEHLPSIPQYLNSSPPEDDEYDFPTQSDGATEIHSKILDSSMSLQSSETSNSSNLNYSSNEDVSDEVYYFDSYVDEAAVPKKRILDLNSPVHSGESSLNSEILETVTVAPDEGNLPSKRVPNATESINLGKNEDMETSNGSLEEYGDEHEEYDYNLGNDFIHHSLRNLFLGTIDERFRSLVFNPAARPHEKFQKCTTPRNETGRCQYVQHCFLPNIIASLWNFMNFVCIIQERFIGICCPDFPVHTVEVKWKLPASELQAVVSENITQPEGGCGVSSRTRIVGGTKADPKEWPWMAALFSKTTGHFFCGGSLINSMYVLTAAHCTFSAPRNQILVRLGEYDFTDSNDGPGEDYPVVEIKRHAQYSRKTLRNDIALLKLARSATFGPFVSTICLPETIGRYVGQMATLAGWGNVEGGGPTSKILLEASFPVWSNAECSGAQGIPVRKVFICAGARTKDKGACNGDSGGPLMLLDESSKRWKSIGVVSWGRRGCDPRFPTVFTRVSEYLKWIEVHASE